MIDTFRDRADGNCGVDRHRRSTGSRTRSTARGAPFRRPATTIEIHDQFTRHDGFETGSGLRGLTCPDRRVGPTDAERAARVTDDPTVVVGGPHRRSPKVFAPSTVGDVVSLTVGAGLPVLLTHSEWVTKRPV